MEPPNVDSSNKGYFIIEDTYQFTTYFRKFKPLKNKDLDNLFTFRYMLQMPNCLLLTIKVHNVMCVLHRCHNDVMCVLHRCHNDVMCLTSLPQ